MCLYLVLAESAPPTEILDDLEPDLRWEPPDSARLKLVMILEVSPLENIDLEVELVSGWLCVEEDCWGCGVGVPKQKLRIIMWCGRGSNPSNNKEILLFYCIVLSTIFY